MTRPIASRLALLALASTLNGCFGGNAPALSENKRRIQDMNERALASVETYRIDDARTMLDEALRIATSLDDSEHQALTLLNMARLERHLGRLQQSERLLIQARTLAASTGYAADLAQEMALVMLARNKPADALEWAEKAFNEERGGMKGRRLNLLARIAVLQGRNQDAERLADQALSQTGTAQMAEERANALRVMAQVKSINMQLDDAERLLNEALAIDRTQERPAKIAADLEALARIMKLKGNEVREKEYLQRATSVRESSNAAKKAALKE